MSRRGLWIPAANGSTPGASTIHRLERYTEGGSRVANRVAKGGSEPRGSPALSAFPARH